MSLQLPTVTVNDLRDFHVRHFPHALAPEYILYGMEGEPTEEFYEEEGELGYYEDGTQRTLFDDQIAIFRHSEIHAIIRKRRQQRENDDGLEEGETEEPVAEDLVKVDSPASQPTRTVVPEAGKLLTGRVEKLKSQQWTTSSPRTKAKNKRNRDKYKAKKRDERLKREQARKNNHDNEEEEEEEEESDEWDPWHQAKGPDVQKDDTVDLDY